jgi:hypothetical protein
MHANPKLRLLQSCIKMNDWDTADEICNSIYAGKLDLTLSKHVMNAVFDAIKWFVDPLYRKVDGPSCLQNAWCPRKKTLEYFEDGMESSIH